MAEFTSRWLEYTPLATKERAGNTDKSTSVGIVGAIVMEPPPESLAASPTDAALESIREQLRAIYQRADFDEPPLRAERSRLWKEMMSMMYGNDGVPP